MIISSNELQSKISTIFDMLNNGENIVITYNGKPKAKLLPYNKKEDIAFGMWNDKNLNVNEYVRNLRKGRVFE